MKEKINVVFLGGFTYPHGMAGTKRVQLFIDYLNNAGCKVRVVTLGNVQDSKNGNFPEGFNGNIFYKNLASSLKSTLAYYALLPYFTFYLLLYLLKIKTSERNILCVYNSIAIDNFLVVLFAKLAGYKTIIDIVEDYSFSLENNSFLHKLKLKSTIFFEKRITLFANAVVVLSSYLEKLYLQRANKKIPVVNIPVSSKIFPDSFSHPFSTPIKVCYSGSFGNKDGLEFLIEGFKKFNSKFTNSVLLLSGAGGNVDKYISKTESNIEYVGYLNEEGYHDFIRTADVLCMTRVSSQYANAGFPFKLGEYLSSGKPVITSNVSDVNYYLKDKEDCIIVEPENSDQIADALEYLYLNPDKAKILAANGKEKAKIFFNFEINGEKLLALFKQL